MKTGTEFTGNFNWSQLGSAYDRNAVAKEWLSAPEKSLENPNDRILKTPMIGVVNDHLISYPTPVNISYLWGFGALAGIFLGIQMLTGILLAMHYTPHVDMAFISCEHIARDVNYGWLLRYLHANGASMFFIVVYSHFLRGLYYGSYMHPRQLLWCSGVVILILMKATAFMGYVLPWGQMSFWVATVITNLFGAIPWVGESILHLLWGGFSVDNATLNRFFSLHYLLPFVLAGLVIVHLASLHLDGSNNPIGVTSIGDKTKFHPYFWVKDVFGLSLFMIVFLGFVFFAPDALGHPDNYIPANPMVTPTHIVPEWYFLPLYAILRSIPNKLLGVIAMFGGLLVWFALPWLNQGKLRSTAFRPLHKFFFWLFVVDVLLLGWIGGNLAETPFIEVGQVATFFYFFYILAIVPGLSVLENLLLEKDEE
jgi:ubiquinol-cytochrome c reductase cytochrome b subunit